MPSFDTYKEGIPSSSQVIHPRESQHVSHKITSLGKSSSYREDQQRAPIMPSVGTNFDSHLNSERVTQPLPHYVPNSKGKTLDASDKPAFHPSVVSTGSPKREQLGKGEAGRQKGHNSSVTNRSSHEETRDRNTLETNRFMYPSKEKEPTSPLNSATKEQLLSTSNQRRESSQSKLFTVSSVLFLALISTLRLSG